jgi:nucleotide-binding universal stress UspA family protein
VTYKTIVLHLDEDARSRERLDLAFELAESFGAHLVAVFAPAAQPIPSFALAEAGATLPEIVRQGLRDAAQAAEQHFRSSAALRGLAQFEWRAAADGSRLPLLRSARYADLVIAAQPDLGPGRAPGPATGFAGDLVLSAGRPVLFVPYAGRFASAGSRTLVAWNASREAARAVSDALPLLQRAASVVVSVFDAERGGDHGEEPGADVGLYLARHGVKVNVARHAGAGLDAGNQILSAAADMDADLIVMGAYGHSRVRELVLGGATRTILQTMTVPVLMSH